MESFVALCACLVVLTVVAVRRLNRVSDAVERVAESMIEFYKRRDCCSWDDDDDPADWWKQPREE